jgi:hypothetical protein
MIKTAIYNAPNFFKESFSFDKNEYFISDDMSPLIVSMNNAERLVLEGAAVKALRKNRNFRQAKEIWVHCDAVSIANMFVYGMRYIARNRLSFRRVDSFINDNGKKRFYLVLQVRNKKSHLGARSYFPAHWSHIEFFKFLKDNDIGYVLLRWYHQLENWPKDDDVDILVDDKDVKKLRELLDKNVGAKAVDIHALSGGESGRHDCIAYFPTHIGRQMIDMAVENEHGVKIPNDEMYFKSLAYHATYQKGYRSKLPKNAQDTKAVDNKFTKALSELKAKLGLAVELNMDDIEEYLHQEGWRPAGDMLAMLSQDNKWVNDKFMQDAVQDEKVSLSTIVLRNVVKEWGNLDELRQNILDKGFELVCEKTLTKEEAEKAGLATRGGNWSSGPWKKDGGLPYHVMLLHDPNPIKPSRKDLKDNKFITNARILFKRKWRDEVNNAHPIEERANFVHASDNTRDALDYVDIFMPENKAKVLEQFSELSE